MRFVLTALLWLLTTVLLAVAIPAAWAQKNVIDRDGYSALAASTAADPQLQAAMAGELGTQLTKLASGTGYDTNTNTNTNALRVAAGVYTSSSAFPGQFAQANQLAHGWLFTDQVSGTDESGRWVIDLSPMLADSSFQQTLRDFGIAAPSTLAVPLTDNAPAALRPGVLRPLATWGPLVSVGTTVLAGVLALLTLAVARSRGKTLAALGISALLVGAAGWAGLEVARGYINNALNHTSGDIRQIADTMVGHAISSMHEWLNLTLAAGGALVVFGVIVALLGGLRRRD
ncbi:hypothetical protein M2272_005465 [Mycobacterium frederiksbergense]|uniref:Uncharacterized protein n=1 Tax=Mycolicibacterium frederiksbergense TaxID=117567 RepID=A0ABT6L8W6_9MYCO|nr:hypothetical protein [Mycolicibacterium frederiksbergense]MDH6198805.1 hypothetical protein [Mycolicibacterium frederiksbergense]